LYFSLGVNASVRQRKYTAVDTLRERKFQGTKVPGPGREKARERKGEGTNWPGNEKARERIGQGPTGRFAPGSELARERKGSVPVLRLVVNFQC